MRNCKCLLSAALLAALPLAVSAQERDEPQIGFDVGEMNPDVIIHEEEDRTIQEYRTNGVLYAVKVIPKDGSKPYFLVRSDGKSNFVHSEQPDMLIPSWKIFEW